MWHYSRSNFTGSYILHNIVLYTILCAKVIAGSGSLASRSLIDTTLYVILKSGLFNITRVDVHTYKMGNILD